MIAVAALRYLAASRPPLGAPSAAPAFAVVDPGDGSGPALHWDETRLGPRPTDSEIDAAVAQLARAEEIRAGLTTALGTQPLGVQVCFRAAAEAIHELLTAGQIDGARAVIATFPLPNADLETVRTGMLAIFG